MMRWVRLNLLAGGFLFGLALLVVWLNGREDLTNAVLAVLHKPANHDQNKKEFVGADGAKYTISGPAIWTKPLGSDICIMDVNTNSMTEPNSAWTEEEFHWDSAERTAPGILNHFLYSRIHGYRYLYMKTPHPDDLAPPWLRMPAISSAVEQGCRFVVYLDTDAIFPHLYLPLEWLLNYWNVTEDTAFAMSLEPLEWKAKNENLTYEELAAAHDEPYLSWFRGYDSKGRQGLNAGVMIIQNTPVLAPILDRWSNCLTGEVYPGCERFANGWPAEQGAFNEHVRYDFLGHIQGVPCDEAQGFPGAAIGCGGSLIRHFTTDKDRAHREMEELVGSEELEKIQKLLVGAKEQSYQRIMMDEAL